MKWVWPPPSCLRRTGMGDSPATIYPVYLSPTASIGGHVVGKAITIWMHRNYMAQTRHSIITRLPSPLCRGGKMTCCVLSLASSNIFPCFLSCTLHGISVHAYIPYPGLAIERLTWVDIRSVAKTLALPDAAQRNATQRNAG